MDLPITAAFVSAFDTYRMGGQKSMVALIKNLDRSKVRPLAFVPREGELSEELKKYDCPTYFFNIPPLKPKHYAELISNGRAIRTLISKENIKIIHPDNERDAFFLGFVKMFTRAKMVWHVRLTEKNRNDRWNERFADGIIGISEATRLRFSKTKAIDDKFRKIFNGVDCELFKPVEDRSYLRKKLNIEMNDFILIFVGQIKAGKGVFDLLEAVKILKEMNLAKSIKLYIIGSKMSEDDYRRVLDTIEKNSIQSMVNLVAQQDNIHEWMQASDALILPSHEGVEGMGRVMFEAMACGSVAIGSDISGVRESVEDDCGILISEKNPNEIVEVLLKLIEDEQLQKYYRLRGREHAVKAFDIVRHARNVEQFYFDLLNP